MGRTASTGDAGHDQAPLQPQAALAWDTDPGTEELLPAHPVTSLPPQGFPGGGTVGLQVDLLVQAQQLKDPWRRWALTYIPPLLCLMLRVLFHKTDGDSDPLWTRGRLKREGGEPSRSLEFLASQELGPTVSTGDTLAAPRGLTPQPSQRERGA